MLEEIPVNDPEVYAFRVHGRLTHEDYQRWVPRIEAILEEQRPISLLVELEDFRGWDTRAARDDLAFGLKHQADFRRIAVVGENAWQKWAVTLIRPFFTAELRYFDREEIDAAWRWLHEEAVRLRTEARAYRHVVAAVSLTPGARAVAAQAADAARRWRARLTLLTAIDDLPFYDQLEGPTFPDPMDLLDELCLAARQRLEELAAGLGDVRAEVAVQTGPPQIAVADYVREHEADLIVVGGHRRHGLGRLLGSVTHGVLDEAPCDVLVVHLDA